MSKFIEIIEKTNEEVERLLNEKGKCALVRPTGFGKTYLFCSYLKRYKSICIVPNNSIKIDMVKKYGQEIEDKVFTYSYILKLYKKKEDVKKLFGELDLLIFDEMHRIGAEFWGKAVFNLIQIYNNAKLLGGTATEFRLDGKNIVDTVFDGIRVFDYSIVDAFSDDILPVPDYVFAMYEYNSYFDEITPKLEKLKNQNSQYELLKSEIKRKKIEMAEILNMPKIIGDTIKAKRPNENLYKFIVFYTDKEALYHKREDVNDWFQKALPNYNLESYTIISKSGNNKMYEELKDFISTKENNTIHIIHSINMLTEGLHIKDLTGIVMLRKTYSNIVFQQQIGRAISRDGKKSIIFDLVANIHNDYAVKTLLPVNYTVHRLGIISNEDIDYDLTLKAIDYTLSMRDFLDKINNILNPQMVILDPEQVELLKDLYTMEYKSFVYLSDFFKMSIWNIKQVLIENGVDITKPRPRFPKKTEEKAIKIYKENKTMSITQIANNMDLFPRDIIYILERNNIEVEIKRNSGKHIANKLKKKIIKLYTKNLLSISKISEILDIQHNHISDLLKSEGFEIRQFTFSPEDSNKEIIELSAKGLSQREICKKTGRNPKYVRKVQKENGIKSNSNYTEDQIISFIPDIIKKVNSKTSLTEIGETYKVSRKTISNWIEKYNL